MQMTKKVLVTGASGFVAAWVLKLLLESGNYHVRATVRSQAKADWIANKYSQYKDKLEFVIVEDVAQENAFEGKLDGLDGIFHVASPFHFKITTSNTVDLLDPAIKGTLSILQSALKVNTIKRIVITSSFAAIIDDTKPKGHPFSEADWNPVTYEQAANLDAFTAYRGSKKLAEEAAYDFVAKNKPQFDIMTINPPFVYGPAEHQVAKLDDLNESARAFYEYISGKKEIGPQRVDLYADVRDVAQAHILAFEKTNIDDDNHRFFITGGNFNWHEVAEVAHKYFPNETGIKEVKSEKPAYSYSYNNSKSINKLGLVYHSKEDTFKDTISQILQFQKEGK